MTKRIILTFAILLLVACIGILCARFYAPKEPSQPLRSVYLPLSHVKIALSGDFYATAGNEKHIPVIFETKAPLSLPNSLNIHLGKCFLQGTCRGNLATQRAEVSLIRLTCIDPKGRTIVNQDIQGYIIGPDGMAGIPGRLKAEGVVVTSQPDLIAVIKPVSLQIQAPK